MVKAVDKHEQWNNKNFRVKLTAKTQALEMSFFAVDSPC